MAELESAKEEVEGIKARQMAELERISGMTAEEAKEYGLIDKVIYAR